MGFEPKPPAPVQTRRATVEEFQGCGALLSGIGMFLLGASLVVLVVFDVTGWCS